MQIGSSINSSSKLTAVRPQSAPQNPEYASSLANEDSFQTSRQTMASRLDRLGDVELRKLAGVKQPGFFRRMFNLAGQWVQGINLALSIGPTVGHLIVAKELSKVSSAVFGQPELSPMDWLRENRPKGFSASVGSVMKAGSGVTDSAFGLSLAELSEVEEHYYRAMAPAENESGIKSTAPYLRELAKEPIREPGQHRSAFVFLGKKLVDEAKTITDLWNSPDKPPSNPFLEIDPRHRIWESLESQQQKGKLPIFVDMDGDYNTFTGTEFVAKKTLSSLGERNNSLGDDFAETGRYFAWLTERQEAYSRYLAPYVARTSPAADKILTEIKKDLTPPWLDGDRGMGPWTAPDRMRQIPSKLESLQASEGKMAFYDTLISLDRDILTGVQTHWIKLLRELKRDDRKALLKPLPEEFFHLNLLSPKEEGFDAVAPPDGPGLSEIRRGVTETVSVQRPYDRSVGMKELLDHALDGLGIAERRQMLGDIKSLSRKNLNKLQLREVRMQLSLGRDYPGIDVKAVLDGKVSDNDFRKAMDALLKYADSRPRTPQGQEARRHASMLEFINAMEHRYGEVDQILPRIQGDFSRHPLGVSEYFIPPAPGTRVTPLREVAVTAVRMGNQQDPDPMKMSLVLEGGGGRGFAYVECLKELEGSFIKSENGYEIDEYIGTSAGSILAVLLAAGYQPTELREVMDSIDFTSFNADGAWLMGGVDPKARGIERTGLFSTQKMYQTFHKLLADKLGIEGRPVLFSDLPHRLKMISTLINTDMAEDNPLRQSLDGDGRFTFSTEATPNFDVVGALVSSAAVPAFFQLPQMLIARPTEGGEVERNRIQMADGGVVDNLSLSSASTEEKERSLVVLPAHTRTRHPETGEWVGLDTLNFSTENLDLIDAHNRELYKKFVPKLDDYFQRMKSHGVERAVIGFNLASPSQQPLPAVQGSSESLTLRSLIHAKDLGMPVLEKDDGDALIAFSQRPPGLITNVAAELFDRYFDNRPGVNDGTGDFHRNDDGFHYHPGKDEAADLFEMGWAAGGAALSASDSEYASRKFQKD